LAEGKWAAALGEDDFRVFVGSWWLLPSHIKFFPFPCVLL
jgi:hypothetical protein